MRYKLNQEIRKCKTYKLQLLLWLILNKIQLQM